MSGPGRQTDAKASHSIWLVLALAAMLVGACTIDHRVPVPQTVGLPYSTAEARINGVQLRVARVDIRTAAHSSGTVVRTVPAQSTRVDRGPPHPVPLDTRQ